MPWNLINSNCNIIVIASITAMNSLFVRFLSNYITKIFQLFKVIFEIFHLFLWPRKFLKYEWHLLFKGNQDF